DHEHERDRQAEHGGHHDRRRAEERKPERRQRDRSRREQAEDRELIRLQPLDLLDAIVQVVGGDGQAAQGERALLGTERGTFQPHGVRPPWMTPARPGTTRMWAWTPGASSATAGSSLRRSALRFPSLVVNTVSRKQPSAIQWSNQPWWRK